MNIPEYNGAGIYKIDFGFACYIGSSVDVGKRLKQHEQAARAGKEPRKLQVAFEIGGEPHVDILEKVGDNETVGSLLEREGKWIERAGPKLNSATVPVGDTLVDVEARKARIEACKAQIKVLEKEIDRQERMMETSEIYTMTIGDKRKGRAKHGKENENRQGEAGNK